MINTFEQTDLVYLWFAYMIVWLGLLAYIFYLHKKQRALEREVEKLEKTLETLQKQKNAKKSNQL